MLAGPFAGSTFRAYSVAAFSVEECGKALCLCALSVLPRNLRAQAPVGRLLEWHQLKQVGGLLVTAMTVEAPGMAAKPAAQAKQIVSSLAAPMEEADRLKRRGLYVDMDRRGRIREPSEITEADLAAALDRARDVAYSAELLRGPRMQAQLANPPPEVIKLARVLVSAATRARHGRTPDAAVDVFLAAVAGLHDEIAAKTALRRQLAAGRASARAGDVADSAPGGYLLILGHRVLPGWRRCERAG